MTERRYSEAEMAEILETATRESRALPAAGEGRDEGSTGFTLVQLQEIAREVGISPEAVALGAAALDLRRDSVETVRRLSGVPIGVSRSVRLNREMSEEEWGRFVSLLREAFDAPGRVSAQPGLREWRNGNLVVTLTPEEEGARLGLRTRRQGWESLPVVGGLTVGMSLAVTVAGVMKGDVAGTLPGATVLLMMGVGSWTYGFVALRSWARRRAEQFRRLAEEAGLVTAEGGGGRSLPPDTGNPD